MPSFAAPTPIFPPQVVPPVGDDGPSVVRTLPDPVYLVPAPRAVLDGPERARRVERGALGVPVTPRPYLGPRPRLSDERVVLGNAPVAPDADDLAVVQGEVLRLVGVSPLAQSEKERPSGASTTLEPKCRQPEAGAAISKMTRRFSNLRLSVESAATASAVPAPPG